MQMLMALAVLITAPIHYSDPILDRQLDRWQFLSEQCRVNYTCKRKGEQNHETCEDREFTSTKTACWQRLALEKILDLQMSRWTEPCQYAARNQVAWRCLID